MTTMDSPVLLLYQGESIKFFTIKCDVYIDPLYQVKEVPFFSYFAKGFNQK